MLSSFRIASFLEGISYLLILGVTLEWISRELVYPLGMAHGILFLVYFILSLALSHKMGWSIFTWLLVCLAAIVPFAFTAVEYFLRRTIKTRLSEALPTGVA